MTPHGLEPLTGRPYPPLPVREAKAPPSDLGRLADTLELCLGQLRRIADTLDTWERRTR